MQQIKFSKEGECVSDYDIEEFYEENKNESIVHIACDTILDRFRVGVKEKDIEPFNLTVIDIDGTIREEVISEDAMFCKIWESNILNLRLETSMRIV